MQPSSSIDIKRPNDNKRPKLSHVVLVEGKHDRQRVLEAVEADVFITGGEALTEALMLTIRRLHDARGVIVLTDPDGPGGRIRRALSRAIPDLYHAYVPTHAAKGVGKIGIEHAAPEVIREALLHPRRGEKEASSARGNEGPPHIHQRLGKVKKDAYARISWETYQELGLSGEDFSRSLRLKVGEMLGIGYGNAKQFYRLLQLFDIDEETLRQMIKVAQQ